MKKLIAKYFRPFWFSKNCESIKVPYFYGFLLMIAMFAAVTVFLIMAWHQYPAGVLASVAGVIGTLAGLYFGVLKLFETGKKSEPEKKND
jgi:hypothetical protein